MVPSKGIGAGAGSTREEDDRRANGGLPTTPRVLQTREVTPRLPVGLASRDRSGQELAKEEWAQTDADDAGPFIRGRDSGYTAFELEIGEEQ